MARPKAGTHWFVGDGYIWDDLPAQFRTAAARPRECSSKLLIYNPVNRTAHVIARFYHPDRPRTSIQFPVHAGTIECIELAELNEIPHRQSFWIEVESDLPILPQARHEDYTFWDPVPDAMVSPTPFPGPLAKQTTWIHPDCFQGGATSWHEQEILTILNPGDKAVDVRVRYLLRNAERGAQEQIRIAPRRIAQLNVWERQPRVMGMKHGPEVRVMGDYAVRIDASGPVISQSTRRARWRGFASIIGSRGSIGFPLPDPGPTLWYYPAGLMLNRDHSPRDPSLGPWNRTDVNWNLLFIHNPHEKSSAHAKVRFHKPDGRSSQAVIAIPPNKSDLQWLFHEPWIDKHTVLGEPFAMSIESDRPVVPEVCGAEFDAWSQIMPGGMTSVNFYPGPLKNEKVWWLGIGQAGAAAQNPVLWEQTWHLMNPGKKPAQARLSFLGCKDSAKIEKALEITPGAVAMISSNDVPGLPPDQPFVVRAESNVPIVAQTMAYTFTRGLKHVRATYSLMGVPMPLAAKAE